MDIIIFFLQFCNIITLLLNLCLHDGAHSSKCTGDVQALIPSSDITEVLTFLVGWGLASGRRRTSTDINELTIFYTQKEPQPL